MKFILISLLTAYVSAAEKFQCTATSKGGNKCSAIALGSTKSKAISAANNKFKKACPNSEKFTIACLQYFKCTVSAVYVNDNNREYTCGDSAKGFFISENFAKDTALNGATQKCGSPAGDFKTTCTK